jgi:hypothetical protein
VLIKINVTFVKVLIFYNQIIILVSINVIVHNISLQKINVLLVLMDACNVHMTMDVLNVVQIIISKKVIVLLYAVVNFYLFKTPI